MRSVSLARSITLAVVLAGVVIDWFAVSAAVRNPSNDASWAAVLLGVGAVAWGITFAFLRGDDPDVAEDDFRPPLRLDRVDRLLGTAMTVMLFTATYAISRWHHRPVDSALVHGLTAAALPLVKRAVDRLGRRRAQSGEAED